jgi:hypothetical protein
MIRVRVYERDQFITFQKSKGGRKEHEFFRYSVRTDMNSPLNTKGGYSVWTNVRVQKEA